MRLSQKPIHPLYALSIYLSLCILWGCLRNFSASSTSQLNASAAARAEPALAEYRSLPLSNVEGSWSNSRWLKGSDFSLALPQVTSLPKSTLLFFQIPGNLSSSDSCGNCSSCGCCCCSWWLCMLLLIRFSDCFFDGQFFRSCHVKEGRRGESSTDCSYRCCCCWCICPAANWNALCWCHPLFSLLGKPPDA